MKKKTRVEDFQDFVDLVNASGKFFVMDCKSFWFVPCGVSQGKYASEKPELENFQVVMFKRRSDKIFWKTKYSQEQLCLLICSKNVFLYSMKIYLYSMKNLSYLKNIFLFKKVYLYSIKKCLCSIKNI